MIDTYYGEDTDQQWRTADLSDVKVWVTEPEVIGTLLGPDGQPLVQLVGDRPLGYRPL